MSAILLRVCTKGKYQGYSVNDENWILTWDIDQPFMSLRSLFS